MKFSHLFTATSALLCTSAVVVVSAKRIGAPSSVLIEDSASGDSGDSDSRKGSQDTDYDSGDVGGYRDHGPLDSSDGPSHNNMFIAAGDSSKGHCVGRGWNTCDRRSPECKWIGNQNDGYCVDNTPNNGGGDDSSFDDGLREGQKTANNLWYSMGNDCANAWKDFETRINREVRDRGWDRSGNWRTQAFNEGAKAGMQKVLQEKSKQCLHDSSYECIDLGNEAARIIAFRYCHPNLYSTNNINKWKKECRDVAIGQCQGQVATKLIDDCGLPNTSTLKTLQNNCSDQVKTMIGEYTEELFVLEG